MKFRNLAIMVAILMSSMSMNQVAAAGLLKGCGADIENYCSRVEPGEGRIGACLYAHSDLIRNDCVAAIEDVALQLEWLGDRITHALDQCAPDISAHCANTPLGNGRIFSCLLEKKQELTTSCTQVIDTIEARLE